MAKLVYYDKETTSEGDIIEWKIWQVDKSKDFPEGIKYSLVYIHNSIRLLGYDNEKSKGHHKHYFDKEILFGFENIEKLFIAFELDIEKLRRIIYGKKEDYNQD